MPFRTVVGHHRVLGLIARAIAHDTLPPALLLAGPAGVGKRMVALAIAEAFNCAAPRKGDGDYAIDACGACDVCRRIARGTHPGVLVIEPDDMGKIGIESVRGAIDASQYRPFEGRRRVVIVDDADAMMPPPQSALLKTLEEPPSATVFLLVSAMPDALLPTVRSRCPRLRFAPLPASEVARALVRDHGYTAADAQAAAADADGSVGLALAAASSDVASARAMAQELLEQVARVDPGRRMDVARAVTPKASAGGNRTAAQAEREQLALCLRSASALLRDIGILAVRADARMLANPDLERELAPLAGAFDGERSMRAFLAIDRALAALDRNASAKVVADWLVLNL